MPPRAALLACAAAAASGARLCPEGACLGSALQRGAAWGTGWPEVYWWQFPPAEVLKRDADTYVAVLRCGEFWPEEAVLKVLWWGREPSYRLAFVRELSMTVRFASHPSFVHLIAYMRGDDAVAMLFERAWGDLWRWSSEHSYTALEEHARRTLLSDILSGIAHLHAHGVLHADVKLDNVFVFRGPGGAWRAKLADLGRSCDLSGLTGDACGDLVFAPAVRPPEVDAAFVGGRLARIEPWAFTAAVGAAADMWALGVSLYLLMFLRLPWAEDDAFSVRYAAVEAYLSDEWTHGVAPWERGLLRCLLRPAPAERCSAVQALDVVHGHWGSAASPLDSRVRLLARASEHT